MSRRTRRGYAVTTPNETKAPEPKPQCERCGDTGYVKSAGGFANCRCWSWNTSKHDKPADRPTPEPSVEAPRLPYPDLADVQRVTRDRMRIGNADAQSGGARPESSTPPSREDYALTAPQLSSERALELAASLDDPRIVQPDTEKATYLRAYASQSEQIEAFELIVLELKVLDLDIKRVCVENERLTRELDQAKLIRGEAVRLHASLVLESKQQAATIRQHEETIARLATHNGELRDEVREILRRCRTAEDERDAALRTVAELQRQFAHAIQTIGERDATIDQLTHENACLGVAVSDAEAKDRSDLAAADRINGELTRANASLRDRLDAVDGDRQAALRELEITFVRTEKTEARAAELDENLAALRRELDTARSDLSRVIVCAQHIEQVAQLTAALRSVKDLASGYTTGLAQDILDIVAPVLGTEGTK